MEPTSTDSICQELEDCHNSLQRVAGRYFIFVIAILVGLGSLFYLVPFEDQKTLFSPGVEATQPILNQSKASAEDKKSSVAMAQAIEGKSEPILALIFSVTSKLVLTVAAFYLIRLLLNVIRYNVKLSNRYKAISFILKLRQTDPTLTMSDLGNLFAVDSYDFMNDKVINSDLTSRINKLLDERFLDLKNLIGQPSGSSGENN